MPGERLTASASSGCMHCGTPAGGKLAAAAAGIARLPVPTLPPLPVRRLLAPSRQPAPAPPSCVAAGDGDARPRAGCANIAKQAAAAAPPGAAAAPEGVATCVHAQHASACVARVCKVRRMPPPPPPPPLTLPPPLPLMLPLLPLPLMLRPLPPPYKLPTLLLPYTLHALKCMSSALGCLPASMPAMPQHCAKRAPCTGERAAGPLALDADAKATPAPALELAAPAAGTPQRRSAAAAAAASCTTGRLVRPWPALIAPKSAPPPVLAVASHALRAEWLPPLLSPWSTTLLPMTPP
eukprot:355552-Chlamydomonas_euryale.AAC.8